MQSPDVSVIIPVFNRPKRLAQALHSVLGQRGLAPDALEILIVDDGSTPPIALEAPAGVRLLRRENGGPAAARNTGIEAAQGRLVAFLDSDDVWLPDRLARQIERYDHLARQADPTLLAVGSGFFDPDRRSGALRARRPRDAASLQTFASGCWFGPGSTVLLSRDSFRKVGPQDASMRRLEDLDWFIRFGRAGGQYHCLDSHDVIIRPSGAAPFDAVVLATTQLEAKYGPQGAEPLPSAVWNRLAAYLALERAVAHLGAGDWAGCALNMARTLIRRPRLRPALLPFWRETRAIPADVQRIFDAMVRTDDSIPIDPDQSER